MSKLQEFLLENIVTDLTEQVVVSPRLKDMPFTINAMSGEDFNEYQKRATKLRKNKEVDFNVARFRELVIINHTLEPSFKDAEFLKKSGCGTPEQLLYKVLTAGEISELHRRISDLSGFEMDMDELVDEAKNA